MKKFNIAILIISATILVGIISIVMLNYLNTSSKSKDQVYLVVKTVNELTDFWLNARNGAEVAATELGVEVIVEGSVEETNIQEQIQLMESIIEKKPEAIAIAASDFNELSDVCEKAIEMGITLVTFDSDVNIKQPHSFIGTDNFTASKRLGHELGVLLNQEGRVAIISHVEGSFTAIERANGFKQGLKSTADIKVIEDVYFAENNQNMAYDMVSNIIMEYPDIKAIFATNEVTLLGCGRAIEDLGLKDRITVVGFDMNNQIALMIEQDIIDATMVQKPFNMGYIAVKEALEVKAGKDVENIDTGAVLINKANMFLPENQKLIVPNAR